MAIPVILDVDTGLDDACALLLAALHPDLDLRAVTCVAGNADVDQVVRNTQVVLAAAGRHEVPVARGATRPLLEPARPARHVHGEDGLGDLDHAALGLPTEPAEVDQRHAVELLRDELLAAVSAGEPVILVPLGPLTNIALLLRSYPETAKGLARIVFMGGAAAVGNATAAAEFNVWHDPEAAAIVLDAARELQVPVTMYGLDVFYDVRITLDEADLLLAMQQPAGRLAGALIRAQCERFAATSATIGDAGAVCAVLDPAGLTTASLAVHVELAGARTRGQTVVDQRQWVGDLDHDPHGIPPTQVDVALGVDGERWRALWLAAVGRSGSGDTGR
ncbi:nucleoside hydrolase [Angustibacter sp. McL0619]|uniref:nucleoside hydrolase n=1 Tax=Angustibacter sp. McL0619 TaxID=3415676 RepID=UPI003CF28958